jgi:NitT/TauT family transport system ATP-binding protein
VQTVLTTTAAGSEQSDSTAPILDLQGVSKRFLTSRHNTTALDTVNLSAQPGDFLCIVGPSGCGKSTLLNIIAGLDTGYEGTATFDGHAIEGPGPERVVVFQEPALFPWLNVRANAEFGLKLNGVNGRERRERVDRYLDLVNLRRFEKAYIHELSGGMRQRAQLARALAVEPQMLLMDEPFAALDAQTRDVLQQELQEIWARTGTTILFVTHNVREAVILADRVFVMTPSPGRLKREIHIDLPRPRTPESHSVVDLARLVRSELEHDIYASPAPEDTYVI